MVDEFVTRLRSPQRMKITAIVLLLFIASHSAWAHCGEAFHISDQEQKSLIAKANTGDADAAYRMYTFHSMSSRNEKMATQWLERAAVLDHKEAQRWLAYMIAENGSPHQTFGKTPQEAVLKLLTDASKTNGQAASDLGNRYQEGYFGEADKDTKARAAYILAASLHCSSNWGSLAAMFHNGEGGDADQVESYYYICLAGTKRGQSNFSCIFLPSPG